MFIDFIIRTLIIFYMTWWWCYCFWYGYYGRFRAKYDNITKHKQLFMNNTDIGVTYYIDETTIYYVNNKIDIIVTDRNFIGTKVNSTNRKRMVYREHPQYLII